jgi:hypothetical protein
MRFGQLVAAYAAGRAHGPHSPWKSLAWDGKNSPARDRAYMQGVADAAIPHRQRARRSLRSMSRAAA